MPRSNLPPATTSPDGDAPESPTRLAALLPAVAQSAAQKEFAELVQALEARRDTLAQWQAAEQACLVLQSDKLAPALQALQTSQLALVHGLAAALDEATGLGLSRADSRLAQRHLCELAVMLIEQTGDASLKALYNAHSSIDYDEARREEAEALKARMAEVYGLNMEQANADSTDAVWAHAREQVARAQATTADKRARRKERNARPEQHNGRQQARQAQTQLSIREVYRRLASALHPDREPDPAMAQRKTALMASVNQAYDKKDLLGLLALQVDLAHIDARSLASASQDQLASYNLLLQGQLREAEREIEQQCASLRRRFCVPPLQALAPTDLLPLVQARVLAARNAQYDVQQGVAALADLPRLRAWLKTLKT